MSDIENVAASALFRRHADTHPDVEVWADEGFAEGGWSYAWIVSRLGESSAVEVNSWASLERSNAWRQNVAAMVARRDNCRPNGGRRVC